MEIYFHKLLNISLNIYHKNKDNKILQLILFIASIFFFIAYKIRLFLYKVKIIKTYSLPAYVISIGNISSGGTGKTSLTIEIAKYFLSHNAKVAILSRGYGSSNKDVTLVSDGVDILTDYETCGDEAYLIAKKVPKALVFSGKDRVKSGGAAIKFGAEVLILDDGFQYLRLNRNENILLLDNYNPFDNYCLLPAGKLRELPDSMKRASSIIISNSNINKLEDKDFNTVRKFTSNKPLGKIYYNIHQLVSLNTKKTLSIEDVRGLTSIACCGIGNPQSFLDILKRNEIDIKSYLFYPDHYSYKYTDIEQMITLAKKYGTENIIVTEKDAVKIEDLCQASPINFWMTKIDTILETPNLFENIFASYPYKAILNK